MTAAFVPILHTDLCVLVLLGSAWSSAAVAPDLARSHSRCHVQSNPRKSFNYPGVLLILIQSMSGYVEFDVGSRSLVDYQEHCQAWGEWDMESRGLSPYQSCEGAYI